MRSAEIWRHRRRVVCAIICLAIARLLVAWVPFHRWRNSLGLPVLAESPPQDASPEAKLAARRLAVSVNRAALHLPISTKCLHRAMAFAWLAQRAEMPFRLKIAVRPPKARGEGDEFHAWVEVGSECVLEDSPGPWVVTLVLSASEKP